MNYLSVEPCHLNKTWVEEAAREDGTESEEGGTEKERQVVVVRNMTPDGSILNLQD